MERINYPGWRIEKKIGSGGFGTVYEIRRDDEFGVAEKAALKVISVPRDSGETDYLRVSGMDDESITSQYHDQVSDIIKEYKMMLELKKCQNIVRCDDYRVEKIKDGMAWNIYLRMELLTPILKAMDRLVTEAQILGFAKDLCHALEVCESRKILHRDIKPQNIFVDDGGNFKLGDFGIARITEKTTNATAGIGTYTFMAPEVYNGKPYGIAADIYSLGLVLYWLLNERREPFLSIPFTALEAEAARQRRYRGEPLPPPIHGSPELQAIVLKACSHEPKERFSSAAEMKRALEKIEVKTSKNFIPGPSPTEQVFDSYDWDNQKTVLQQSDLDKPKEEHPIPHGGKIESSGKSHDEGDNKKPRFNWKHYALAGVILLAILCGVTFLVMPKDAVTFQDPRMEGLVREMLEKPKGAITKKECESIIVLDDYAMGKNLKVHEFGTLDDLALLPNLRRIGFDNEKGNLDYSPLKACPHLRTVGFWSCEFTGTDILKNLPNNLEMLSFMYSDLTGVLQDIPLSDLICLEVTECDGTVGLDGFLENQKGIEKLNIDGSALLDYNILRYLENLRELELSINDYSEIDYSALGQLTDLEQLNITGAYLEMRDLSFLANMQGLQSLALDGVSDSEQLQHIEKLSNLKKLALIGCKAAKDSAAMERLQEALPNCEIKIYDM